MSAISDLAWVYLHRKLAASGNTPTVYTVGSGSARTVVCAALTESAGYWAGALLRWDSGPNAGLWSSIESFDADTDTLTLDEDLPSVAANGHTFTLLHGGKYASDQAVAGLVAAAPVNVTGLSVAYAAHLNGVGTGVLKFYYNGGAGAQAVTWTPPGGAEGVPILVGALAENDRVTVFGAAGDDEANSKFIVLARGAAALPVADAQDDLACDLTPGNFLAAFSGAETETGKTVYRAVALKNTGAAAVQAIRVYCPKPWSNAADTTIAAGGAIGTDAAVLKGTSFANWGKAGFVFNATKNDLRYYYGRSGNTVQIAAPGAGLRGCAAVTWEVGDALQAYPFFDIGLDAPGGGSLFEDPASETAAPAGVTFSCPRTSATGLLVGDLAAGALYCVWLRVYLPAGAAPLEDEIMQLIAYAEVTE